MILFCEDCGKKNLLNSIQFIGGKPNFRCSSCGYLNPYHFTPQENTILKKADFFLKEAKAFPEIIGSFLFHREIGVIKNHMPEILNIIDLDFLGKNLTQPYEICQSVLGDVNEMVLAVADKNMIVKMMGKTLFMILACKTEALPRGISEKFSLQADQGRS